jgi:G3E family GTPase
LRQCAVADRRLITKTDLADATLVAALSERLFAINPGAPVEPVSHGAIDAARLLGAGLYDTRYGRSDVGRWLNLDAYRAKLLHRSGGIDTRFSCEEAHDQSVGTWLVEEVRPVDWEKLSSRLGEIIARHGDRLLRVKGVICTVGDQRPLVVQGVQRLFHSPARLERWTGQPTTSIVIIGDKGCAPAVESIADALAEAATSEPIQPVRGAPALVAVHKHKEYLS